MERSRSRAKRGAALAFAALTLAALSIGVSPDKASALDGCWWYANEMGRNSNCDGVRAADKPECVVADYPLVAEVKRNGSTAAVATLWYYGDPCRTVDGLLVRYDSTANCYIKVARTQSGGGEKSVADSVVTPMLYNSGRRAYAWAACTWPDGYRATAKTAILYTPPVG
jgi:hypothetical protein